MTPERQAALDARAEALATHAVSLGCCDQTAEETQYVHTKIGQLMPVKCTSA